MPAAMSWSAAKRAFFLDLLELVRLDPNARSRHPLPQHLLSFVEDAGCTLLFLLADTTRRTRGGIDCLWRGRARAR